MKRFLGILFLAVFALTACSTNVNETKKSDENVEPVLSNGIFKVVVPDRFDGLFNTEVKDNAIDFYDKECISEGNPGWIFGLYVYQNPSEWAGGPIEKVGELTLQDGKLYDVVIAYPTETQFGVDREMPEKYKNFYEARYDIASNVTGLKDEKVLIGAGAKGEGLYDEILKKHLTALKENWDANKYESENMSPIYVMMAMGDNKEDKVGYAYCDLNLDGIEELLIGEVTDSEWKNVIYDIYTMVDRKPMHVVSGWDRNRYYAVEGGLIANEYSNGASESGVHIYALTTNETELMPQIAFKYDQYANEENPWFIAYSNTGDEWNYENVEESRYSELEKRFEKHLELNYKSFSTIE